ncbi:MAG TPA: serine/threonine-protein kinase [Gemmataceae bacterium]
MTRTERQTTPSDSDQSTWAWDMLASRLDACSAAWVGGTPPPLGQFLPPEPPSLRRLVLTELVKLDQEQRVSHGLPLRRVEDYAVEFPELAADGGVPCDLLYEEFHLRRRSGEPVDLKEYLDRFPDRAGELARLLGAVSTYATTTLRAPGPTVTLNPGDQVDDFDLLTLLGEGAFAKVFLARQRSLQRLVALKVSANRGVEPQTLAQLDHPHIVRVYDQRTLPGGGLRLLYMPYVSGGTLQSVLQHVRAVPADKRTGRTLIEAIDRVLQRRGEEPPVESPVRTRFADMTWPQAVAWLGVRLADALHYAHRRGVLHRDIKPANVLLTADGAPRLADFNVGHCSKLEGIGPRAFFGGSLVYMSPEQLEAFNPAHDRDPSTLDGRSDLYSLGVTLWELLTGERPFGPESVGGPLPVALLELTARRRAGIPAEAAGTLPPDTTPHLERALRRCLAPDPADRFPDAAAFGRALELALQPRAAALLDPPPGSWRHLLRRWPLACLLATGLVPNLLAGWFNFDYNWNTVIRPSGIADLQSAFLTIQAVINAVTFPLGVAVFILLARPVLRALAAVRRGADPPPAELAAARRKSLRIGWYGVWVSVGFWLGASVVYPVCLTLAVPDLPADVKHTLAAHFLVSLALCGLIAASYPFFFGTALATGAFYPMLLRPAAEAAGDREELRRLETALWRHVLLAAAVPLFGVVLLVLTEAMNKGAMIGLCLAGLIGLGMAVVLTWRVQQDIRALRPLLGPSSAPVTMDESLSARSWGG